MTEIEELLEAAKKKLKQWSKPTNEVKPSYKDWEQMLDRPYGRMEKRY